MSGPSNLSPLRQQRRDRIVATALALFTRQGVRGTTMEEIADAAGVSKVTVYGYFADKDAVFAAVGEHVCAQIIAAVADAVAQRGTIAQRVAAALIAKQKIVHEAMRRSAFAAELFAAKHHVLGERIQQLDADICAALARVIAPGAPNVADASAMAHLLFAAADGIAQHGGGSFPGIARDIRRLCALALVDGSNAADPE